jgi:hypothetical protein
MDLPGHPGQTFGCTAFALAGLDVVMTNRHCAADESQDALPPNTSFQFAPLHRGNCTDQTTGWPMPISACERKGGQDPFGYWSSNASSVYIDSNKSRPNDFAFIVMNGSSSSSNNSLTQAVGGIPIVFNAPHGQGWIAAGYPLYMRIWQLEFCTGSDKAAVSDQNLVLQCAIGGHAQASGPSGSSGGPWVNSANSLPLAAGALNDSFSEVPNRRPLPGVAGLYNPPAASGAAFNRYAMQLYVQAALASMQPGSSLGAAGRR